MSETGFGRPVVFGEVLFDHFPDGSVVLGGAPFNVACHLQAFGLSPLFISRVGDDPLGRRIRAAMLQRGMDCSGLQLDSAHPTGSVEVRFVDGEPHYDIVAERAYDFIEYEALPPLPEDGLYYHGSLALRNPASRATLRRIKQGKTDGWFVDVNLRAPWWSPQDLADFLVGARWIKLNQDELYQIAPPADAVEQAAARLLGSVPAQLLVVTRGAAGASAFAADGSRFDVQPQQGVAVVDSVGAGDAFSSVLLLGQARGWGVEDSLARAQAFASAIVGIRGATVSDAGFYRSFLSAWGLS